VSHIRRHHAAVGLLVATTVGAGIAACSSHGTGPGGAGGMTGTSGKGGNGGGPSADAGADAPLGPHATTRIADFAKPLLLYLDVCVSTGALSATTKWVGPLLRGTYDTLQNSKVSSYLDVPAGARSVRFVLADSPSCNQTLEGIPDFALDTPLAEGSRTTLLFGGTGFDAGTRGLQLVRFDDVTEPADGGNSVRFINAAQAESSIDIYAYSGFGMKPPCTLVYDDVAYATAGVAQSLPGDGGPTAANGYAPLGSENLYDLTFSMLGYTVHGAGCNSTFGSLYSTDGYLGQGAWTVFVEDEGATHVMCRDDGTMSPFCIDH
jgi:hypothetical protein